MKRIGARRLKSRPANLAGFPGDLGAFLPRFRKADGDGLLTAGYAAALATFAGTQGAAVAAAHGAGDGFACSLAVSAA